MGVSPGRFSVCPWDVAGLATLMGGFIFTRKVRKTTYYFSLGWGAGWDVGCWMGNTSHLGGLAR